MSSAIERGAAAEHSRSDLYRGSLHRNRRTISAALEAMLAAPPGAIVVHCKAGADRTGILTALILDAVGVDREHVVQDYASYTDVNGQSPADTPSPSTMIDTLA